MVMLSTVVLLPVAKKNGLGSTGVTQELVDAFI